MHFHTELLPEIKQEEKIRVLMVINSNPISLLAKKYLERQGQILVTSTDSGILAIDLIKRDSFDVVMSDYDLLDMDAISFHTKIQELGFKIPFLIFNITDTSRKLLEEFDKNPLPGKDIEPDISIIFNEQSQKILQSVELHRVRNRLEVYSRHLEELVGEQTRQLQIAQRFAVIGEIATMIGHDMRNPLQVITNSHYLLKQKVKSMSPEESGILTKYGILDLFTRINDETHYLNKIVSDLQDYAREISLEKVRLNPANIIDQVLLSLSFPDTIIIHKELDPDIVILIDPILLTRVMKNLIINAIQAMEKGGTLTIKTQPSSDSIRIIISDTGIGIPPGSESRIFDPLFTTKPKGTGLGLSVTKRLIEVHGGSIMLEKTSDKGTTFVVTLPVS
ncbi:MAG: hypothetical protein GXY48_00215 [Methanomicrobiales archaeon]|nr:hypothetical protein [Methanomicrobiales archaeon]